MRKERRILSLMNNKENNYKEERLKLVETMKECKQERGITLVALVITIIIIIILATVAISFTFGNNGLIKRAEDAGKYYTNDTKYTEGSIANVESYIDGIIGENEGGEDQETNGILPTGPQISEGMIPVKYVEGKG